MGTDISDEDIIHIQDLSKQIIEICEYREELFEYIKSRMRAIAPNLTVLVGELVGARLIAHAGSLINLAKHPASTVQILGAEKALFRALKTKKATPKYGLIYHASIVGQTTPKNKGKISRILANKAAISCRVDALGDEDTRPGFGMENLIKVQTRLQQVDGKKIALPTTSTPIQKYEKSSVPAPSYNPQQDVAGDVQMKDAEKTEKKKDKKDKKEKKEKKEKKDKKEKEKEKEQIEQKEDGKEEEKTEKKRKRESTEDGEPKKKKKKKSQESQPQQEVLKDDEGW